MDYIIMLLPSMLKGLTVTLKLFSITLVMALPWGNHGYGPHFQFQSPALFYEFYVWLFRGTPCYCSFVYVFWFDDIGFAAEREMAAYLAFVLNYSAYLAEIFGPVFNP